MAQAQSRAARTASFSRTPLVQRTPLRLVDGTDRTLPRRAGRKRPNCHSIANRDSFALRARGGTLDGRTRYFDWLSTPTRWFAGIAYARFVDLLVRPPAHFCDRAGARQRPGFRLLTFRTADRDGSSAVRSRTFPRAFINVAARNPEKGKERIACCPKDRKSLRREWDSNPRYPCGHT
jgi:hypothetical protein